MEDRDYIEYVDGVITRADFKENIIYLALQELRKFDEDEVINFVNKMTPYKESKKYRKGSEDDRLVGVGEKRRLIREALDYVRNEINADIVDYVSNWGFTEDADVEKLKQKTELASSFSSVERSILYRHYSMDDIVKISKERWLEVLETGRGQDFASGFNKAKSKAGDVESKIEDAYSRYKKDPPSEDPEKDFQTFRSIVEEPFKAMTNHRIGWAGIYLEYSGVYSYNALTGDGSGTLSAAACKAKIDIDIAYDEEGFKAKLLRLPDYIETDEEKLYAIEKIFESDELVLLSHCDEANDYLKNPYQDFLKTDEGIKFKKGYEEARSVCGSALRKMDNNEKTRYMNALLDVDVERLYKYGEPLSTYTKRIYLSEEDLYNHEYFEREYDENGNPYLEWEMVKECIPVISRASLESDNPEMAGKEAFDKLVQTSLPQLALTGTIYDEAYNKIIGKQILNEEKEEINSLVSDNNILEEELLKEQTKKDQTSSNTKILKM